VEPFVGGFVGTTGRRWSHPGWKCGGTSSRTRGQTRVGKSAERLGREVVKPTAGTAVGTAVGTSFVGAFRHKVGVLVGLRVGSIVEGASSSETADQRRTKTHQLS
jgi:hypothetical protein